MDIDIKNKYELWLNNATLDIALIDELKALADDQVEDAFYRNLEFGTGGLRGIIGAGTNRINVYTVAKATQGLANYLKQNYENPSVVIGYDSRIKSDLFAKVSAKVFSANNVKVYIWSTLIPVPCVSFAVRCLKASAGVMITASHNPSKYNGYKVYGDDGCQITTDVANKVLKEIEKLDVFSDIKYTNFEDGLQSKLIEYVQEDFYDKYIENVEYQSVLFGEKINKNISIVYTPLNGTGLKPITRVLKETGYSKITVVSEQKKPDGNFPTCPYPNPEIKDAMKLGVEYAKKKNADLLLATDPDCDRVGIALKNKNGEYELLSGNQVGILLLDYICSQYLKNKNMPKNPLIVKTIVTTDLAQKIATSYGVSVINVLTGFKFIGEQIGILEKKDQIDRFIFGFEESYGYLKGTYVRDKDGVVGAFLICEMFCYYATRKINLIDKLNSLYEKFGYCLNTLHSYEFEGSLGVKKIESIMQAFRGGLLALGGETIERIEDYLSGVNDLPRSNVIKFILSSASSVVVRPSGTEPKLKIYISANAKDKKHADELNSNILYDVEKYIKGERI